MIGGAVGILGLERVERTKEEIQHDNIATASKQELIAIEIVECVMCDARAGTTLAKQLWWHH